MTPTEKFVPNDGQCGNPFADVPAGGIPPFSRRVFTAGISPHSHINKRILVDVFRFENVANSSSLDGISCLDPDVSVVVGSANFAVPGLMKFLSCIGKRSVILDIRTFARMANIDGCGIEIVRKEVPALNPIKVFQHRMEAEVFPNAPAVIVENAACFPCGFSDSDRFHLFSRNGDKLSLTVVKDNEKLSKLLKGSSAKGRIWASSVLENKAAVIVLKTPEGGQILVFDLDAVNRPPEPSGSENPAVHLLLSGLGVTRVSFGKFTTAQRTYEEFAGSVEKLHLNYPEFTKFETVGRSRDGREMKLLTLALDFNAPPILLTTGIHPLEWAPNYGVARYLMHLLEQCRKGNEYAKTMLAGKRIQWLICACPDGWETRDLQPPGIDLNRNFPGSWERCVPGETYWDAYNMKFSTAGDEQLVSRGPGPGSQPETKVMMRLLEGGVTRLADFHETTAFESFFHPPESDEGTVPNLYWYLRLNDNMLSQFNGRFFTHGNIVAFRPALADFKTYRFREQCHLDRIVPGPHCGWIMYTAGKKIPAMVIEASGCDCTHYQTIRRTEYAASAAEQILGNDSGAFIRNPFAQSRDFTVSLAGMKGRFELSVCDGNGCLSERKMFSAEKDLPVNLSPDWTAFIKPHG